MNIQFIPIDRLVKSRSLSGHAGFMNLMHKDTTRRDRFYNSYVQGQGHYQARNVLIYLVQRRKFCLINIGNTRELSYSSADFSLSIFIGFFFKVSIVYTVNYKPEVHTGSKLLLFYRIFAKLLHIVFSILTRDSLMGRKTINKTLSSIFGSTNTGGCYNSAV